MSGGSGTSRYGDDFARAITKSNNNNAIYVGGHYSDPIDFGGGVETSQGGRDIFVMNTRFVTSGRDMVTHKLSIYRKMDLWSTGLGIPLPEGNQVKCTSCRASRSPHLLGSDGPIVDISWDLLLSLLVSVIVS